MALFESHRYCFSVLKLKGSQLIICLVDEFITLLFVFTAKNIALAGVKVSETVFLTSFWFTFLS